MNEIDDIKESLKQKGFKLTTQRRAILDVIIENREKHLSSEEIYELVKEKYPEIGLATVYRTLQLFDELGVIYKLNFDDGRSRYELYHNEDHQHHHLICLKCGSVIEMEGDLLENLEEAIENTKNFQIVDHNVKFFGYCSKCKQNKN
ncbi:Fur family transcriptional regulator [Thermoanaerobacterium thermosaccharolyticum]|uniref:Ferric uptake regulator, Fur family n=3 Tax=Thermoanaerobacterium thermosaccharolyticum TaxID=1517 RepID=D9TQ79_THETC|nr:Fur family transcriptional regulator [Thermoanaerobacterium thermosaccharolyticum]TCW37299.1 Fur family ferric uptake transcriptional regulator [Thermohydrogenium kirishiense]ADL68780.1 ferric uptake regulator, Fur family [Thermoanaerobacterium thermosaccharolyticum DSM 571]AGB18875.1 Fe2+/Zn2+ uptake regulation protein [Thermoanaerobacterium thermosaccharolyticum M0795]AST59180.1 Fur family transcriptional regulator [Thermoanaerobacterium thermosaccharolyticum]KAA5807592.1 transcriptional 